MVISISNLTTDLYPWVVLIVGAIGYVIAQRFAGRPSALAYAEQEVKRLERQCGECDKQLALAQSTIALLEQRTDIAKAILPFVEQLRRHEVNAAARNEALLDVMNLIAQALGAEKNGTE